MCSISSCGRTGCLGAGGRRQFGFPLALFAKDFDVANTVATDSGVVLPLGAAGQQLARQLRIEAGDDADLIDAVAVIERWSSVDFGHGVQMRDAGSHSDHPAAGVSPYLVDLTDRVLFGDIWERPQLSKRDRSLVTMAVLMKEFRVDELHSHVRRALDNGVTREEIGELIVHLAFYGGWPVAANAIKQVKVVYDDLDGQ